MDSKNLAETVSENFAAIYHHCHPEFTINLSHQSIRALQFIAFGGTVTVQEVAGHLGCAQNTASEILRRLQEKGLLERRRRQGDERVVELQVTRLGQQMLQEQTGLDLDKLAGCLKRMTGEERDQVRTGFATLLRYVRGDQE